MNLSPQYSHCNNNYSDLNEKGKAQESDSTTNGLNIPTADRPFLNQVHHQKAGCLGQKKDEYCSHVF